MRIRRSRRDAPKQAHEECTEEEDADPTARCAHELAHLPSVGRRVSQANRPFDGSAIELQAAFPTLFTLEE